MEENSSDPLVPCRLFCQLCNQQTKFSAAVAVLLVYVPGMKRPYPLITDEDYRVCENVVDGVRCASAFNFVDIACRSHNKVREAGLWSRAILLFNDGRGVDLVAKRPTMAQA